jgi:hypothetical protein
MVESSVKPGRLAPDGGKLAYLWEVEQKPVSVRIDLQVGEQIGRKAAEAVRSVTGIGSEIGGLLLGTVTAGKPILVTVEDFKLIQCDYRSGPLYRFGEADLEQFDRAVATQVSARSRLLVVGFFRSHTRKGLALDAADIQLVAARFGKPHQIVLLIQPSFVRANRAGIFIWENGTMHAEATYCEFTLSSGELVRQAPVIGAAVPAGGSRPVEGRPQGARPALAVPAPDASTRARVLPIAAPLEAEPVPAPPRLEPAARKEPKAGRAGLRARVGRCSEKVELRDDHRLADASHASADANRQSVPLVTR